MRAGIWKHRSALFEERAELLLTLFSPTMTACSPNFTSSLLKFRKFSMNPADAH